MAWARLRRPLLFLEVVPQSNQEHKILVQEDQANENLINYLMQSV